MIRLPRPVTQAWLALLLLAASSAWGWVVHPEQGTRWVLRILMLVALWGLVELVQGGTTGRRAIIDWHRRVIAGVALWLALGTAFHLVVSVGLLDAEWRPIVKRTVGVLMGIGLAVWGNYLPRVRSPWRLEEQPFDWQAVHRFVGWGAVICGLALALVWLLLPLARVPLASSGVLMTFAVVAIGRKLLSVASYSAEPPPVT